MTRSLIDLPSHLKDRLAKALESGLLPLPPTATSLRSTIGGEVALEPVMDALAHLHQMGLQPPAVAAWIRALSEATTRVSQPDLVWSGPRVDGVPARETRSVFNELLGCAAHSVWVSTFAFFDGPRAFQSLSQRMDQIADLRVTLLLNIQRKRGDPTAADFLVRRFADRFWKTEWPGESRPRVFYDPRALELEGTSGVLHAKAVVVDTEAVLVTSANLTEAAMDRNIELGVLLRDRAIAGSIVAHLVGLIDGGLLSALPGD
jgi:phosphatidylserine/phosphatidylglycerophosphate/cardiolipin synthase-like enzyme